MHLPSLLLYLCAHCQGLGTRLTASFRQVSLFALVSGVMQSGLLSERKYAGGCLLLSEWSPLRRHCRFVMRVNGSTLLSLQKCQVPIWGLLHVTWAGCRVRSLSRSSMHREPHGWLKVQHG